MKYTVTFRAAARREFDKLPQRVQDQIMPRIDALSENPRPSGVTKLSGEDNIYRVRSGIYRVAYSIQDDVLVVLIVRVATRGEIYKKRR